MKNLKQVLALGMAFSLSLSTMASAAFTDQKDIKAAEAVDMLAALGVIQGYEDGSFKPEGTVTRAEAAKMIYTIRNGGNSNADSFKSVATSFTDISGHWAEGYIKYCQSMGIIAGKSATTFDPNGTVTGVELAKMMLVTLGYNAEKAGLVGATWSQKTLALAGENGLLDDVYSDLASGCPRQYAAQIMYNSVLAPTVVLRENVYSNKNLLGTDNDTIGEKYMGLVQTTVKLEKNSHMDGALKNGEVQVSVTAQNKGTAIAAAGTKYITFKVDKIETKIGEDFKLLWKDINNNKDLDRNDKVYGMYTSNTTSVINITANDIDELKDSADAAKVKLNGTKYEVATSGNIYNNYQSTTSWTTSNDGKKAIEELSAKTGDKVRVILNENNKITDVYVIKSQLYKVTAVSGDKISIAGVGTIDKTKNDTIVYDGIAKDDVVAVTQLYKGANELDDATFIVEKAETVTGKLTGYTGTKKLIVDGTTYKIYGEAAMKANLTDDYIQQMDNDKIDTTVTLYLVNGYVQAAKSDSEQAKQYAIVTAVDQNGKFDSTFNAPRVELVLADGTKKTVTIHKDSTIYNDSTQVSGSAIGQGIGKVDKNTPAMKAGDIKDALKVGDIVKYVEMSNGQFKVEECAKYDTAASAGTQLYDKDAKTFAGTVTSGDCVLFYNNADNTGKSVGDSDYKYEIKATTIRSLNNIKTVHSSTLYSASTKDGKVVAAYIDLGDRPSGATAATVYGIISADPVTTNKDGDTYKLYKVDTNEGTLDVYAETKTTLRKGDVVGFDKSSNNTYIANDFTVYYNQSDKTMSNGMAVAITEYDEKAKTITYATEITKKTTNDYEATKKNTLAVDNNVKIAYINADGNKAGDTGFGVQAFNPANGYLNAILVVDTNNKVVGIIVNTNDDTNILDKKEAGEGVVAGMVVPTDKQNAQTIIDLNNKLGETDVNFTGDLKDSSTAIVVPANTTLKVGGKLTLTTMPTINGTLEAASIDASGLTVTSVSDMQKLVNSTSNLEVKSIDMPTLAGMVYKTPAGNTKADLTIDSGKTVKSVGDLTLGANKTIEVNGKLIVNDVKGIENIANLSGKGTIQVGSNNAAVSITEYVSKNTVSDATKVDNTIAALKAKFTKTTDANDGSTADKPWANDATVYAEDGNAKINLLTSVTGVSANVTATVEKAGDTKISTVTYADGALTGTGTGITVGDLVVKFTVKSGSTEKIVYAKFTTAAYKKQITASSTVAEVNEAIKTENVTIEGDWTPSDKSTAIVVPDGKKLTVNGKLTIGDMPNTNSSGNITATSIDATGVFSMNGTNVEKLFKYSSDVTVGEVTDAVTVDKDSAKFTATSVVGKLTVTNAAQVTISGSVNSVVLTKGDVTVGSITDYASSTSVAGQTLTITGDVSEGKTLPAGLAGTTVFAGNVTGALTLDAASNVVFNKSVDIGTVIDTNNKTKNGAKITFKEAPTNLAITANNNDGFFATTTDGTTAETEVGNIKLDVVYTNTASQGDSTSHSAWVPAS